MRYFPRYARLQQHRPDVTVARFLDTFTEGETEGVPVTRYDTLDGEGNSLVDFVGRFETLGDDFKVVRKRLGTTLSLPHLYKSKRPINAGERPWASVAATCDRYARDMELFNYA